MSRKPSQARAPIVRFALVSQIPQHFIRLRGGELLVAPEYPDPVLLAERRYRAHRAQGDVLALGFEFHSLAGLQMQFVAQYPGDDNAPCPIRNPYGFENVLTCRAEFFAPPRGREL